MSPGFRSMLVEVGWRRWAMRLAVAIPAGLALCVAIVVATSPPASNLWLGDRSLLEPGPAQAVTGDRVMLTDDLRSYSATVRIDAGDIGRSVDPLTIECHGGMAWLTWHIGDLEPVTKDEHLHLSARFDGRVVGTLLIGSQIDTLGDSPQNLQAVVACPAGQHTVDLLIVDTTGAWGFPFVVNPGSTPNPDLQVNRGFIVREVWSTSR